MAASTRWWDFENKSYSAIGWGIKEIPKELLCPPICHDVRRIKLPGNEIKDLPSNIGTLWTELRELLLDVNKLRYIPESVCDLKKLESLHVNGNKLKSLTPSLAKLTNLKSFNCDQIEGVLPERVKIVNNPTEIRQLWDKLFPQKT
uniref:Leucine-rich repeat-containing protein 57-like n=1 Tax=Saccoglossus kowalevskii TaxID=10224 RepID=A0ABM0LWL9_SACKO